MNLHHLLRLKRLVQHPPSRARVLIGLVAIGLCLAVVGIEALGFWPAWLTTDRVRAPRIN